MVKKLSAEHVTLKLQVAVFVKYQNESVWSKCKIEVVVRLVIFAVIVVVIVVVRLVIFVVIFDEEIIFKHLFIKSEKNRNCKWIQFHN